MYTLDVLHEKTGSDSAQLAIFIEGVNDQLQMMQKLLPLCLMRGCTTAKDIFSSYAK